MLFGGGPCSGGGLGCFHPPWILVSNIFFLVMVLPSHPREMGWYLGWWTSPGGLLGGPSPFLCSNDLDLVALVFIPPSPPSPPSPSPTKALILQDTIKLEDISGFRVLQITQVFLKVGAGSPHVLVVLRRSKCQKLHRHLISILQIGQFS